MSQGVVRLITAGSVDDGKSTLIGRLLYDTKSVLTDQLLALSKTRHARVAAADAAVDLALITDGLEAEREQGITIDVAYRYFSTQQRKFIVADAPGHEQYTRNLVTGASQVDVAIILVDATRVDLNANPVGLLAQTKRHAAIVRLLALQPVAVAINKMDLLDFDQQKFDRISQAIVDLAGKIGLPTPQIIPVSALAGDNVVHKSTRTPWYQGPCLLEWLELCDTATEQKVHHLRFPVQVVARQDGGALDDFRGYLGRIESGTLAVGQKLKVMHSGSEAVVSEIYVANDHRAPQGRVETAKAGQAVTVRLDVDIDISRGDMLVAADDQDIKLSKQLTADICWLDRDPLSLSRKYVLRHTSNSVFAKITNIIRVLDIETLSHTTDNHALKTNEIGRVALTLQKPIAADLFDDTKLTGAFILIDETSHHTVAAGMIREIKAA